MEAPADTLAEKPGISLHGLICEDMQMNPPNFGNVATGELERACYQFDVAQLARITDGFTGSEIDAAFTEAMFLGFTDPQSTPFSSGP